MMPSSRQSADRDQSVIRTLALRVPSGHRIQHHKHSWVQLVFAARGVMNVIAENVLRVVPPQRCLWLPAHTEHSVEMVGETWLRTLYLRGKPTSELFAATTVLNVAPLLRELILEIVRIGALDEQVQYHRDLHGVLLAQLRAAPQLLVELALPSDPRARFVSDLVRNDVGSSRSLAALATGSGGSARTLERLFVKETGLSFGRWRQQARLQHALRRLAEGHGVTSVALECGYDSTSAFIAMFKKSIGVTPGRYVNRSTADDV